MLYFFMRNHPLFFLIVVTVLAISCGLYIAIPADPIYASLMDAAPSCRVSIVDLLIPAVLPFFLAAVSILFFKSFGLLLLCFLKLSGFTALLTCIMLSWGKLTFYMSICLLFSCSISSFMLFWFILRQIASPIEKAHKDLTVCFLITIAAAVMEYMLIAPFLAKIIL